MFGVRLGLQCFKSLKHTHKTSNSRIKPLISHPIIKSFYSTMPTSETLKKFTILDLHQKFAEQKPLTMVTAYDYTSAVLVDRAGIDLILVGDSVGMVCLGLNGTTSVTMEDMIHHSKAVMRGAKRAFVVGDMPFGSYEANPVLAAQNAIRLVKEGGVEAVKMEGGKRIKESIRAVINAGIPVIGHLGLTPQTMSALGGFKVQGKTSEAAKLLLEEALELESCGVSAIVLESVPEVLASHVTKQLKIPTIGIGAGVGTSGQVLVFHDMLGLYPNFVPKFCKQYANLSPIVDNALKAFKNEVEEKKFPAKENSYSMKSEEFQKAFPKPTIAIVGAGSMGSLIGAKIAATGEYNVAMVSSWEDHINKINHSGLLLTNVDRSTQRVDSIFATNRPEDVLARYGKIDFVLILVKSPNTKLAAEKAQKLLQNNPRGIFLAFLHNAQGIVVTLQNGMGNREIISNLVGGDSKVVQGVTSHGSMISESGKVIHTGMGPTSLAFGPNNFDQVKRISEIFNKSGINCELVESLESMLWGKLIVNAGINPVTAILRLKNGELLENAEGRNLLIKTVNEAVAVAKERGRLGILAGKIKFKGIKLPYDDALESVLGVAKATSGNISSMYADVLRGVTTEINAINGVIVKEGEKMGLPVQTNRNLVETINGLTKKEEKMYI